MTFIGVSNFLKSDIIHLINKETTMHGTFQGIEGLTGHAEGRKQAWGGVVTIGTRHIEKGFPTEQDKFFIKKPQAISIQRGGKSFLYREPDPDFTRYNQSTKPELRQAIRFHIVHPINLSNGWESAIDAFQFNLKAFQIPGIKLHENKIPTCLGNGIDATRWNGSEFLKIKCPNNLCQFRQGKPKTCKPYARFAFQLRWPDHEAWSVLPTPMVKFETHSWHNIDKVLMPFFMGLHKQAQALNIQNYSLYGLPGVIKLGKRIAGAGKVVPSISIATDFKHGMTLQGFLINQKRQLEANNVPTPILPPI
mgnify:CR=1 FL=1